jgi:hypothetical protein
MKAVPPGKNSPAVSQAMAMVAFVAAILFGPGVAHANAPVWVGRFGPDLQPWQEVQIKAEIPRNRFAFVPWDGVDALEVRSNASMSLFARPLTVDLDATPVLCWRWRIDAPIAQADMGRRDGDDYAARVYVSFKLPDAAIGFGLRTKLALARTLWGPSVPDAALNYVWDNRHPVGTERPNVYTDRAMMVVLRSGAEQAGTWVWERRHVKDDVTRLFSPGARPVQLAVTADTDNTRQSARSGFADFHFVSAEAPCVQAP